ncbi:MAG: hypothetical protein R2867_39255 [Caldilineaceae bacterium]
MKKNVFNGLGILQVFIGIGAVAGGLGLALDPSGASLGTPLELLEETPFTTFLIPGIVLFTVNGLGTRPSRHVLRPISLRRRGCAGARCLPRGLYPCSGLLDGGVPLAALALSYSGDRGGNAGMVCPQDDISRRFEYSVT